jgi:hypothetical protein
MAVVVAVAGAAAVVVDSAAVTADLVVLAAVAAAAAAQAAAGSTAIIYKTHNCLVSISNYEFQNAGILVCVFMIWVATHPNHLRVNRVRLIGNWIAYQTYISVTKTIVHSNLKP